MDAVETERFIVAEQQLRALNHPSYQNTWSPMSSKYLLNNNYKRESRASIHHMSTINNNNNQHFHNYRLYLSIYRVIQYIIIFIV